MEKEPEIEGLDVVAAQKRFTEEVLSALGYESFEDLKVTRGALEQLGKELLVAPETLSKIFQQQTKTLSRNLLAMAVYRLHVDANYILTGRRIALSNCRSNRTKLLEEAKELKICHEELGRKLKALAREARRGL